ncbi:MAG TPA: hypothetical protein DGT21_01305 [Armatimonadetes bacterium]|nr:hypothetical protein [Armatimonadota bacterium]
MTVCGNWERVHEELRRVDHMPVSGILRGAQIVDFSDGTLVLGFCAEFHHGRIENSYKELVEDALGCTFGTPVHVECRLFGSQQELDAACHVPEVMVEAPAEPPSAGPPETAEPGLPAEPDTAAPPQPAPPDAAPADETPPEAVAPTVAAEPEQAPAPVQPPGTAPVAEPEPEQPLSQEQAVAQTLRLFEGSTEIADDDENDDGDDAEET